MCPEQGQGRKVEGTAAAVVRLGMVHFVEEEHNSQAAHSSEADSCLGTYWSCRWSSQGEHSRQKEERQRRSPAHCDMSLCKRRNVDLR